MITTPKRYMDFQWAFSTLGCPDLGLDAICQMARDFDLSYIELRATEGSVELPKLFKERFGHPDSLARYLDDQQVNICCLDTSLKLVGNDEVGRKAFLEFLPWADALGTTALRVFDGGTMEHGLDDEAFAQAQDTINWWKQEKERSGWETDMGIETHDALVGSESIDRIFKSNPDLNIIWDTHHTWKKSNDSIETSWNHLGPNVNNVHVKDSISVPSARHLFTYVNFGEGEFPLDETLRLLQCQGYKGFVTIEWERMWHPYMSDIREALQKARDLNWF